MLDQIPLKQSYTKKGSKKKQALQKKKFKRSLAKHNKKLITIAIIAMALVGLSITKNYLLDSKKYEIQEIIFQEFDKTFVSQEVVNHIDERRGENYWLTKWNSKQKVIDSIHGDWIQSVEIIDFEENVLYLDVTYNKPDFVFSTANKQWGSKKKSILPLWTGLNIATPTFELPSYHSWDIQGIFHKTDLEKLTQQYALLQEINPTKVEFHPWTDKIIAFVQWEKIALNLAESFEDQLNKYALIKKYFSWTVIREYDLSSAPYAIIKQ